MEANGHVGQAFQPDGPIVRLESLTYSPSFRTVPPSGTERGLGAEPELGTRTRKKDLCEELGADRLSRGKNQTELRKVKKEIIALRERLAELEARRAEIEKALKT